MIAVVARIDTLDPVGENERLFRSLRAERSRAGRRGTLPWSGVGAGSVEARRRNVAAFDFRWGVAKLVKAPDFDSGIRGFESFLPSPAEALSAWPDRRI